MFLEHAQPSSPYLDRGKKKAQCWQMPNPITLYYYNNILKLALKIM